MIFSFAPCVGTITGIIMTTQDIIADPENNLTFLLLQGKYILISNFFELS